MRTVLLGELVPVMTSEGDPVAVKLKGYFLLFSFSLADGGMDVFFFLIFSFCLCLHQPTLVNNLIGVPSIHAKT